MNDSNNIFNNNVTPTPQNNNPTGVNPIPEANNLINEVNSQPLNTSNISSINPTQIQNETPQSNPIQIQQQPIVNQQIDNATSSNEINSTPVNPLPTNNVNSQPTMQPNQSFNNNIPPQQNISNINSINDEELLKAFIGNNYEKITTRPFNFAGFFFTTFYMFYRKMFGYALLVFLLNLIVLNVINNFIVTLAFNVLVGLFVNKIYLYYAKKKIAIIKASNSQMSTDELKRICATKGGTSVGKIFLGFFTELGIAIVVLFVMTLIGIGGAIGQLFNPSNWNITVTDGSNNTNDTSTTGTGTLLEDVSVNGYDCMNSKCNVTIETSDGNSEDYTLGINNSELFNKLGDYKDYIKLNIYYTKKGNTKTIVDYKIYSKSTNEEIGSVNTESELRDKLGLYSIGTHTNTFTLKEIGTTGFGFKDDNSYTYTEYTFTDEKNVEYEMKYINDNGSLNLTEGNKYNVTFEVSEGTFEYEFTIKSIN